MRPAIQCTCYTPAVNVVIDGGWMSAGRLSDLFTNSLSFADYIRMDYSACDEISEPDITGLTVRFVHVISKCKRKYFPRAVPYTANHLAQFNVQYGECELRLVGVHLNPGPLSAVPPCHSLAPMRNAVDRLSTSGIVVYTRDQLCSIRHVVHDSNLFIDDQTRLAVEAVGLQRSQRRRGVRGGQHQHDTIWSELGRGSQPTKQRRHDSVNPLRSKSAADDLVIGTLNCCSMVKKAAQLHDVIADHHIDVLAMCESWMKEGAPDAIAQGAALDGCSVLHAPRPSRAGGLAVIHRRELNFVQLSINQTVTSFEFQVCKFAVGVKQFILLNIYRPPSSDIDDFVEELPAVIDELTNIGGRLFLTGDFNCAGNTSTTIDDRLSIALSEFNLVTVNSQPTRFDKRRGVENLLDLIIESDTDKLFHSVRTMSVTFSDHCLVTARLRVKRPPAALVTFSYRDIKKINLLEFRTQL